MVASVQRNFPLEMIMKFRLAQVLDQLTKLGASLWPRKETKWPSAIIRSSRCCCFASRGAASIRESIALREESRHCFDTIAKIRKITLISISNLLYKIRHHDSAILRPLSMIKSSQFQVHRGELLIIFVIYYFI